VHACSPRYYVTEGDAVKLHSHSSTASRNKASYSDNQQEGRSCDLAQCERTGRQWISVSVLHAVYLHPLCICAEYHIHSTTYRACSSYNTVAAGNIERYVYYHLPIRSYSLKDTPEDRPMRPETL
jgi:hypothetical protein